jgi:hypothetical protein
MLERHKLVDQMEGLCGTAAVQHHRQISYDLAGYDFLTSRSRIFHHNTRTCNFHWDGLCQERIPSESTGRHMDVSISILMPQSLLVLS